MDRRTRPFATRLRELASRSGTGVHDWRRATTRRESRPRFSGVSCVVQSLALACHAGGRKVRIPSTPPTSSFVLTNQQVERLASDLEHEQYDQVIELMQKKLELDPDAPEPNQKMGRAYVGKGHV